MSSKPTQTYDVSILGNGLVIKSLQLLLHFDVDVCQLNIGIIYDMVFKQLFC